MPRSQTIFASAKSHGDQQGNWGVKPRRAKGLASEAQLTELLEQYGDATFFLEKLIEGLKKKQRAGDWDKSFGAKEEAAGYSARDADHKFMSPDMEQEEGTGGNSGELTGRGEFRAVPPHSSEFLK